MNGNQSLPLYSIEFCHFNCCCLFCSQEVFLCFSSQNSAQPSQHTVHIGATGMSLTLEGSHLEIQRSKCLSCILPGPYICAFIFCVHSFAIQTAENVSSGDHFTSVQSWSQVWIVLDILQRPSQRQQRLGQTSTLFLPMESSCVLLLLLFLTLPFITY